MDGFQWDQPIGSLFKNSPVSTFLICVHLWFQSFSIAGFEFKATSADAREPRWIEKRVLGFHSPFPPRPGSVTLRA